MARPLTRLAAALCCCALAFTGCTAPTSTGSGSAEPGATPAPSSAPAATGLVLGYVPADGFNPYLTPSTLVAQNAGLLFEKLVEIGPDMALSYRLASGVDCVENQVILHIRSGCTFADGAPITAEDAAASLRAAQASGLYGSRFAGVTGLEVQDGAVVLTLAQPDSLFAYLCDIPVFKASETALASPTASGRYTYGAAGELVRNSRCAFPEAGPETIRLAEVGSYDEMVSGLAVGTLNLYAASETLESSASVASKQTYYRTNNLVFLGVNAAGQQGAAAPNPLLASPGGRALLSRLIDRRQLAEKSYYSRAYPATGAINSFYPCVMAQQSILAEAELDAAGAGAAFTALGFQKDPLTGYYQNADGERLTLRLLVYSGSTYKKYAATLLQQQLGARGLYLQVEETDNFDAWSEKVALGDFDLYIGEVKLYNNMDMSPFFEGGGASAGILPSEALAAAYAAFKRNQSAAGAFEAAFAAEMPFVPLLWRNGVVVHSRDIGGLSPSLSNVFYSLADLRFGAAQNS